MIPVTTQPIKSAMNGLESDANKCCTSTLSFNGSTASPIKEIPKNLKDQEEVLNKLKIDYIELTENLKKLQQEYEEINAEYLEMGKKKEELESNINQTVLVRETESMNKEIDSAKLNEQNLPF